ncbi:MAG: shikimate kinase [Clostridia bacterium]|nr:shikimate kinase [Clostridia bacterium]
MKNIVLTGYMASGKTTVGRLLCNKLGMEFYDTDEMIEKREGITINEIFNSKGELYFRDLESQISEEFENISNSVISTGGGFVLNTVNIENLRKNGIIFNLNVSPEIIERRYEEAKKTRPLMNSSDTQTVLKRYADRKEYYKNCDVQIDINDNISPDEICNIIIKNIEK